MHCRGRLHVVFGCGGDRDAGKRPLMGAVAAELADDIVITDDNPRTEDPAAHRRGHSRRDRRQRAPCASSTIARKAIRGAMAAARAGDVVLIAGKGHEDYQIYGRERRPFSDQAVVREQLKRQA